MWNTNTAWSYKVLCSEVFGNKMVATSEQCKRRIWCASHNACIQWDILYRWSCGEWWNIKCKISWVLVIQVCFSPTIHMIFCTKHPFQGSCTFRAIKFHDFCMEIQWNSMTFSYQRNKIWCKLVKVLVRTSIKLFDTSFSFFMTYDIFLVFHDFSRPGNTFCFQIPWLFPVFHDRTKPAHWKHCRQYISSLGEYLFLQAKK